VQRSLPCVHDGDTLHLALQGAAFSFTETSPYPSTAQPQDHRRPRSPVAGVVAQVAVAVGDTVAAGQPLLCVEAMKMEMWLHAGAAGTVQAVHAQAKDSVAKGAVLVELQLDEPPLDGQGAP
jgi:geranyl-CoA carboxylase alpha subunit